MKTKNTVEHPFLYNSQKISEEGVLVFHNVKGLPTGMDSYVSPYYVICVVHSGSMDVMYDDYTDTSRKGTIAVIFPNHSLTAVSQSDNFRISIIVVSELALNEPMLQIIKQFRYRYESRPAVQLGDHEYRTLMNIVNLMYETSRLDIEDKRVLVMRQLDCFLRLLNHYRQGILDDVKSVERISTQFHTDLVKHFRQHRDVGFYAEQVCLSTKYFSKVILQETGYTASYWIHHFVVSEAQMLLHTRPDLSIQAIADNLGFGEQQTFSRYFRRETGMSPTEFREKH